MYLFTFNFFILNKIKLLINNKNYQLCQVVKKENVIRLQPTNVKNVWERIAIRARRNKNEQSKTALVLFKTAAWFLLICEMLTRISDSMSGFRVAFFITSSFCFPQIAEIFIDFPLWRFAKSAGNIYSTERQKRYHEQRNDNQCVGWWGWNCASGR